MTTISTRFLRLAPGLSAAVIGTLGLGVGAMTTAFGLLDAALLRPPPFRSPERLVMLYQKRSGMGAPNSGGWSYPRAQLLRSLGHHIGSVANFSGSSGLTLVGGDNAEPIRGEYSSASYFEVLGVRPLLGRFFTATEDSPGAVNTVTVLSADLWMRRFGGDSTIIGRAIRVNGVLLTVIGVMQRGFRGLSDAAQIWCPSSVAPRLTYPQYLTSDQAFISVVSRLRPGESVRAAGGELAILATLIDRTMPVNPRDGQVVGGRAVLLNEARVDPVTKRALLLLFSAVSLLHLLACTNVTSLLLGRAVARRREAAVRAALGGTRSRLFRQFYGEGFALALCGGALGIAVASWASASLGAPTDVWRSPRFAGGIAAFAGPSFTGRVVLVGAALALVSALLVAWPPAVSTLRGELLGGLRESSRMTVRAAGSLRRPSAQGVIVALETALAVLLAIGGGLVMDSFRRMRATNIGVDAEHVLTFWLRPPEARYPTAVAPQFISRILAAINQVPGVVASSVEGGTPGVGTARGVVHIVGRVERRPEDVPMVLRHYVGPDHFRTLGISLLRGRTFTAADAADRPLVAVISQSAARRFWPGEDPIGRRIWFSPGSNFGSPDSSAEVVGIVSDVRYEPLERPDVPYSFYTPYMQFTYSTRVVLVRAAGDPVSLIKGVTEAVHRVEPEVALTDVRSLSGVISGSWARHRFDAVLFGAFAVLAIILAATGTFAVTLYATAQRTREMGIRLALGSSPVGLTRLVLRDGMVFPGVGLILGIVAALALTRVLGASLYGITPTDPAVFAGTVVVLLSVSLLACLTPARRAARCDPLDVLRAE